MLTLPGRQAFPGPRSRRQEASAACSLTSHAPASKPQMHLGAGADPDCYSGSSFNYFGKTKWQPPFKIDAPSQEVIPREPGQSRPGLLPQPPSQLTPDPGMARTRAQLNGQLYKNLFDSMMPQASPLLHKHLAFLGEIRAGSRRRPGARGEWDLIATAFQPALLQTTPMSTHLGRKVCVLRPGRPGHGSRVPTDGHSTLGPTSPSGPLPEEQVVTWYGFGP